MKKLTIVYGFDREDQIPLTVLSIKSIKQDINLNIDLKIFVSNEYLKNLFLSEISKIKLKIHIDVIIINCLNTVNKRGMYFWLLSPYHTDSDYILQLDNDTILNCRISDLIPRKLYKEFPLYGVRIKFDYKFRVVQTISDYIYEKFNIKVNSKKSVSSWINSGIVLINRDLYLDVFEQEEDIIKELMHYLDINNYKYGEKLSFSDEAFVFSRFFNNLGKLKRRYNLRIHSFKSTEKLIKSNNYIFHYNKKIYIENKLEKIDMVKIVNDEDYFNKIVNSVNSILKEEEKNSSKNYGEILLNNLRSYLISIL